MRREDTRGHDLPSFARYLNKVFDFRQAVGTLTDSRTAPKVPAASVFLAVFYGFVFRLRSFQQLERELTQPALQRWVGARDAFGDDVLRYSLCGFQLAGLEAMLVQVNRKLKRNKAFDAGRLQGRIVAAVDGIEVLSSYGRCCEHCLERRVVVKQGGVKVEQVQYYHRAVGCQIVSGRLKSFLPSSGSNRAKARTPPRCVCCANYRRSMAAACSTSWCSTRCTPNRRC